jgi:hypothetical protein
MKYNEKYYVKNTLWQLSPKRQAINTFITKDAVIIGMFQGNRGQFKEIDFIVRVLKCGENETPFPPPHSFWVVDLMLKISEFRNEVKEILEYYLSFYDSVVPFKNASSRNNYKLQTVDFITQKYNYIEQQHTLSLEYVSIIIELFCINEKRNDGAYMFRDLLKILLDYTNNKADYIQVMQATKPGFR